MANRSGHDPAPRLPGRPARRPHFRDQTPKEIAMEDIATKDVPDISGITSPDDEERVPSITSYPADFPRNPNGPLSEPLPGPIDPEPLVPLK
jgi:hypothetical protein